MSLLSQKFTIGNATVTICHTRTKDIAYYTKQADILIVAVGQPEYVTADMIKKGVHILDVGINRVNVDNHKGYKIVGDADWDAIYEKVASATPVPPEGSNACTEPMGGNITGILSGTPSNSVLVNTLSTLFNIRGRKTHDSTAARLRRNDASLSAAPVK